MILNLENSFNIPVFASRLAPKDVVVDVDGPATCLAPKDDVVDVDGPATSFGSINVVGNIEDEVSWSDPWDFSRVVDASLATGSDLK